MHIKTFRGMTEQTIDFQGKHLNAIIGQNAAMKTTILGMLSTPFSLRSSNMKEETTISGEKFESKMKDKFNFSDKYDLPGTHNWTLTLDQKLYPEKDFSVTSIARKEKGKKATIRFWNAKGRNAGDGFIQFPVIYLSLGRLMPIGENKKIIIADNDLTDEENFLYEKWHNEILICMDKMNSLDLLEATSKSTIAPNTDFYDSKTISAGQDNIGKIILAVLSMKRLKDKFPHDYHGGIICIDELESTLYPASQLHVLDFLQQISKEYGIQFFFTTHSLTIIKALYSPKFQLAVSITYLQRIGKKVSVAKNVSYESIEADLYLKQNSTPNYDFLKPRIYCEDEIAMNFVKSLIKGSYLVKEFKFENLTGANLSNSQYITLLDHKISEFLHSIIILDGDTRNNPTIYNKLSKYKNVVLLPLNTYPEEIVYSCLKSLESTDSYWNNSLGGYTKQMCFQDAIGDNPEKMTIKNWMLEQKGKKGTGYNAMFKEVIAQHPEAREQFIIDFQRALEYVKSISS